MQHKKIYDELKSIWPATVHKRWMSNDFKKGLVSVVVSTYNRCNLLMEAIQSVYSQTYRPIELIIVDDGSSDDTEEKLSHWIKSNNKQDVFEIKYFYQQNQGANVARNLGFIHSNGEYIQILDSDDILHPQKFFFEVFLINRNPKVDYVWSKHRKFNSKIIINEFDFDINIVPNVIYADQPKEVIGFNAVGLYTRNSFINAGPWDEKIMRYQDADFMFRYGCQFPKTKYIQDVSLYFARHHEEGRIFDYTYNSKGIKYLFYTLNVIETNKQKIRFKEPETRNKIAKHYIDLTFASSKYGTKWQVIHGLRRIWIQTTKYKLKIKALILLIICIFFGKKQVLKLLVLYSKKIGHTNFE